MKPIRDQIGRVVGYDNDVNEYRKEIRSKANNLLAWFNPSFGSQGATFDRNGKMIGYGDQRGRFIGSE